MVKDCVGVRKIGVVKYAQICVYAPVNEKTRRGQGEMKLWEELGNAKSFENGRRIILLGNMNAKVRKLGVWLVRRVWME